MGGYWIPDTGYWAAERPGYWADIGYWAAERSGYWADIGYSVGSISCSRGRSVAESG